MILLHDFVTDFVAVISSPSEGLGKMALGIVKIYLGSTLFAVSCRGPDKNVTKKHIVSSVSVPCIFRM